MCYFLVLLQCFQCFFVFECSIVDPLWLIYPQLRWQQLGQCVIMSVCKVCQHRQLWNRRINCNKINKLVCYINIIKSTLKKQTQIMNQKISFSDGVTEYISKALQIWPALQLSLHNLPEAVSPPQQSPIPPRNYKAMSSKQFLQTLTKDLYNYIYQHDVKVQHIMDYLDDILAILHTTEQEQKTVRYMANQLVNLVNQLPDGDASRLVNFRFLYNSVKGQKINCKVQQSAQFQEEEQDSNQSNHSMQDQDQQQSEDQIEQQQNVPKLVPQPQVPNQQQQNEDNDGWIVIKKKSKK